MKTLSFILLILVSVNASAQEMDFNLKKGYAAKGYDVIEYFSSNAIKGDKKYAAMHQGATYTFTSQENLNTFQANPGQFVPEYGGYCAYAIAVKGAKVDINPETFEIRDGKLYLFYNAWGTNTLDSWIEEGAEKLVGQANAAWTNLQYKQQH